MQITQEEINAHWTEGAENYSDIIDQELASFRAERWKRKILGNAPQKDKLDILDIGCGPGFFSILLAEEGHRVTGIDGSGAMLREAEAKAARRRETREVAGQEAPGPAMAPVFRQMDAHHPEFPDHSFDLLVSRNVTHTLRDHRTAYRQWLRVLRPCGVLLIFDANWHLVKADPALQEDSRRRYEVCVRKYGDAFDRKTPNKEERRQQDLEGEHMLGDLRRPDWDMGLLLGLGYTGIRTERDLMAEMWDEKEILLYGNTPLFMIRAEKPA